MKTNTNLFRCFNFKVRKTNISSLLFCACNKLHIAGVEALLLCAAWTADLNGALTNSCCLVPYILTSRRNVGPRFTPAITPTSNYLYLFPFYSRNKLLHCVSLVFPRNLSVVFTTPRGLPSCKHRRGPKINEDRFEIFFLEDPPWCK